MATIVRQRVVSSGIWSNSVLMASPLRVSPVGCPVPRRHAQAVGDQHPRRYAVEMPGALRHVGARLAEEQPLAEIRPLASSISPSSPASVLSGSAPAHRSAPVLCPRPSNVGRGLNQRSSQS